MTSGVLVVAKPAGMTSFDVVAGVRRALRIRRVGHGGTLDPEGTGVLPVLIGEATKLMPYLVDQDKEYRVVVRFGVTTDTLDSHGHVLSTSPVSGITRDAVARAATRFIGRIQQVPPMYSAVHYKGRRLYELARRGLEVDRDPREVVVHEILVEDASEETATLRVVCGKGTYVRVLVADLGAMLGSGAVVARLVRTRVGPFALDDALGWDAIQTGTPESLGASLRPPEAAIANWSPVRLDAEAARAFEHGQSVSVLGLTAGSGTFLRVHDARGALLGVGELTAGGARVRPVRVLHVDRPGTRVLPA